MTKYNIWLDQSQLRDHEITIDSNETYFVHYGTKYQRELTPIEKRHCKDRIEFGYAKKIYTE